MNVASILGVLSVFVAGAAVPQENSRATHAVDSTSCPVTQIRGGIYGNEGLEVVLPNHSTFVFEPGGPGFVDRDGALGMKFAWERHKPGQLHVGGRRIDGPAAPARAYITDYGDVGFQPIYMVFPTEGCWEITGAVADARLTFVVSVKLIGEGPSRRFDGPPRGWRSTQN